MFEYTHMRLEFGSDGIRGTLGGKKGRGALVLRRGEPRESGVYSETTEGVKPDGANQNDVPIALFFNNAESVDAFIDALKIVRKIVEGEYSASS